MRLADWFRHQGQLPITYTVALLAFAALGTGVKGFYEAERRHRASVSQNAEVIGLALAQKNRALLESILQTSKLQLNAKATSVCRNGRPIAWTGEFENSCESGFSWVTHSITKAIPGFQGYALHITFPIFMLGSGQLTVAAMLIFITLSVAWILGRMLRKLQAEIILPLRKGILGQEPLPIIELEEIRRAHNEAKNTEAATAAAAASIQIARQVAHDIRSPLSALNIAFQNMNGISDEKRKLINLSISRINGISNDLLTETFYPAAQPKPQTSAEMPAVELVGLLDSLVSEKRLEFANRGDIQISSRTENGSERIGARIDCSLLSRVISNLINNAVEAISSTGSVYVVSGRLGNFARIRVVDDGCGIPSTVLSRLGNQGVTEGKIRSSGSGSGLGLWHAKQAIEGAGGRLEIVTKAGVGTEVKLLLPFASLSC